MEEIKDRDRAKGIQIMQSKWFTRLRKRNLNLNQEPVFWTFVKSFPRVFVHV